MTRADPAEAGRHLAAARWSWATVALLVILTGLAAGHSAEDFAYAVPSERFGIDTTPAAWLLGAGFAAHTLIAVAVARRSAAGYALAALLGAGWTLAALLDHAGEVIGESDYRGGIASKLLEAGIVLAGIALAAVATRALIAARRR